MFCRACGGRTYTIDIKQKESFVKYNIEIGVSKSVTHINGNQISGNITYEKQGDGYFYTPLETGKYIFRMWISDVECDYRVVVKNSVNHVVKMWHNGIKETGVEMEKGETYLIDV